MCELLGMSSNIETDIAFSLSGLLQRADPKSPNNDGWGVAYYANNAAQIMKEPIAGGGSLLAQFSKVVPIPSKIIISHIRRANRGKVCFENTHPFSRELWGQEWVMAHNGQLKGVKDFPLGYYKPFGSTDSEHAFCWMLGEIRRRYPKKPPTEKKLAHLIDEMAAELGELGVFNMLLSDSKKLYVHCSTRLAVMTHRAPFEEDHLMDADLTLDVCASLQDTDIATIVATVPLTESKAWKKLKKGNFLVLENGVGYNKDLKPFEFL